MHRFFLIFLIALLPLRAWVGDSMAMPAAGATTAISAHCAEMMAGAEASTMGDAHRGSDATKGLSCSQCQLCHLLGLAVAEFTPLLPTLPAARITQVPTHFASVEPTLGFKPPLI